MQIKLFCFAVIFISQSVHADVMFCKRVKSSDGNIVWQQDYQKFSNTTFKKVCNSATVGKDRCVKITDVQVQSMSQAIRIAKEYAKERYKDDIACYPDYFTCYDNDDHILCATANNSVHYEFVFDDITETRDARYKKGIGTAVCKIYMGDDSEITKNSTQATGINYFGRGLYKTGTEERSYNDYLMCYAGDALKNADKKVQDDNQSPFIKQSDKMQKMLENYFGYTAKRDYYYSVAISFRTLEQCPADVNKTFKTQQINLGLEMIPWLGGYWSNQTNKKIDKFTCDLASHTCKTGNVRDPRDDILDCTAKYTDGSSENISFLFNDLSEPNRTYNSGAKSMMQCMTQDGANFDGGHCRGLKQDECAALGKKIGGDGTRWDEGLKACVLVAAEKAYKKQRSIEVAETVGIGVLGTTAAVVITVVSGGSAVPVVLAAGATVFTALSERETNRQRAITNEFISKMEQCNDKNCGDKLLNDYINEISYYTSQLGEDQLRTLDDILARKLDVWVGNNVQQKAAFLVAVGQNYDKSILDGLIRGENVPPSVRKQFTFDAMAIVCDILALKGGIKSMRVPGNNLIMTASTRLRNSFNPLSNTADKIINTIIKLGKDAITAKQITADSQSVTDFYIKAASM